MYLAYLDQHPDQLNNHRFLYNRMPQQMLMDIHHNKHELKYLFRLEFIRGISILSGFAFFNRIIFFDDLFG
jgi:hypothetical protein